MKKYVATLVVAIVVTIAGITVASADYRLGPNNIFKMSTRAGTSIRGLWVEGTMSNAVKDEASKYEKQVYARSGASGTYSEWASKSTTSITHRDYGSFDDDYAEVRGYWRQ